MAYGDTPTQAKAIVKRRLAGVTMKEIARQDGVSEVTVHRSLKNGPARQLLEAAYGRLVEGADRVATVLLDGISGQSNDLEERKFRHGAAKDLAGMIGLSPVRDSHNNVFFTGIIAPTTVTLNPIVEKALGKLFSGEDSIEAEYVAQVGEGDQDRDSGDGKNSSTLATQNPNGDISDLPIDSKS